MRARVLSGLVVVVTVLGCGVVVPAALGFGEPHVGGTGLFAQLRGSHERSGGSPGRGSFAAVIHQPGTLCFGLTLESSGRPSAAQLHRGTAGHGGPAVLAMSAPASGNLGASSGCVTAKASVLKAVRAHPGRFYVEVITANGGLRGQLFTPTKPQDH
jgi:hypothetical protein